MHIKTCLGCGTHLVWSWTMQAKAMPLNAQASMVYRDGDWVIEGENCRPAMPMFDMGPFHRPHWAECPHADQFRAARVPVARFGKGGEL